MTTKRTMWSVLAAVLALFLLLFFAKAACSDEVDAARNRLKAIEAEKQQAAEVQAAKAAEELAAQAKEFEALALTPVPDPISEKPQPSISFSHAVGAASRTERLPRAVLITSQACSPCERIKTENAELIGGPMAPIQLVPNWLANDLEKWGITPGMQISTPVLFVLDKDGKVHGLTTGGLTCCLRGYHSADQIKQYLQHGDHQVSLKPDEPLPVVAEVENADVSPETFAAVLAAHLAESSGQQADEPMLYGGLFDFNVDVPESWKQIGVKILTAQKIEFAAAGITVDWTGATRSFNVSKDSVVISPPVRVTLKKWFLSYAAALDGVQFSEALTTVTVLLTGAPDLTIHLR